MADALEQALREKVATKNDVREEIDLLRLEFSNELGMFKGDLLAAMKANKIDVLTDGGPHVIEAARPLAPHCD